VLDPIYAEPASENAPEICVRESFGPGKQLRERERERASDLLGFGTSCDVFVNIFIIMVDFGFLPWSSAALLLVYLLNPPAVYNTLGSIDMTRWHV